MKTKNIKRLLLTSVLIAAPLFALNSESLGAMILGKSTPANTNGLVGHWTMDGPDMDFSDTAAEVKDTIGGNNGDAQGGMGSTNVTRGKVGQALEFDGSGERIHLNDMVFTDKITISAWAKSNTQDPHNHHVVSEHPGWFISGNQLDGSMRFGINTGSETSVDFDTLTNFDVTEWHHYVGIYDGSYITTYLDGVQKNRVAKTGAIDSSGSTRIGAYWNDPTHDGFAWEGLIDDVRIYNRALGAAEVYDLYRETGGKAKTSSSQTDPLTKGLVGYWPLDDGTGTTATDASVNGNDGTLTNMEEVDWMDGQIGGALNFGGDSEYIDVTANENTFDCTNDCTWSAWINQQESLVNYKNFLSKEHSGAGANAWMFRTETSGLNFYYYSDGWQNVQYPSFATHQWNHVLAVRKGTVHSLYVNGILVDQATITGTPGNNSQTVEIGGESDLAGRYFNGYIDDVRIYNRALSADEIALLYQQTAPTSIENGLVGHWTFDGQDMDFGDTAAEVKDVSGSGNDGDINTNYVTPVIGKIGQAIHFDGTNWERIALNSVTNLEMGTNDMTISGWVNITPSAAPTFLFSKKSGWTDAGYQVSFDPGFDVLAARICNQSAACEHHTVSIDLDDTGWHLTTFVIDRDGGVIFYLDGVLLGTSGTNIFDGEDITSTIWAQIGSPDGGVPVASIDDVRIYNRTLSADEVYDLYLKTGGKAKTSSSQTDPLTKGLVGYWPLDDGTGTTATDASVNGNDGTLTNGPTWTTGQIKQTVEFDGTNDKIIVPYTSSLDLTSAYTLSAWINTDTISSGYKTFLNKNSDSDTNYFFEMYNGQIISGFHDGSAWRYHTASLGYTTGTWYHVAAVFDNAADTYKLYSNGAEVLSESNTYTPVTTTGTLGIGSSQGGSESFWDGKLDDVRIYNRTLSANEVSLLYKQTAPTEIENGLIGHWTFDGQDVEWSDTGTEVKDAVGINNGEAVNLTTADVIVGKLGQAIQLEDAQSEYIDAGDIEALDNASQFTISAWMKRSATGKPVFIAKGSGAASYFGINLWTNGSLYFDLWNGVSGKWARIISFNDTEWHHVAVVFDGSQGTDEDRLKLFADGQLATSTYTGTIPATTGDTTGSFLIGRSEQVPGTNSSGSIDEVRVYDRPLTASEVEDLYLQGK